MNHNEPYSDEYLRNILSSVKTIAMVGASPDKTKFSYGVLRVLHETGYDMIPVNPRPGITEIRGLKVYPDLKAIDKPIDMVEVFRKPEDLYAIAEESGIGFTSLPVNDNLSLKKSDKRVLSEISFEIFFPFIFALINLAN